MATASYLSVPFNYPRIDGLKVDESPVLVRHSTGDGGRGNRLLIVTDQAIYADGVGRAAMEGTTAEAIVMAILARFADKYNISDVAIDFLQRAMHTTGSHRDEIRDLNRKRLDEVIYQYQPTHTVLLGRVVAGLIPRPVQVENPLFMAGRPFEMAVDDVVTKCTVGLDLNAVTGDDGAPLTGAISLIGQVYYAIESVFCPPPTVDDRITHHLVDTWDRWQDLKNMLLDARYVAIDCEANNTNRLNNVMLTLQFSTDGLNGYTLPIGHKDTPWTGPELELIRGWLQKWLEGRLDDNNEYHIYHFGKFDLLQMKREFKVRRFYHKVYDMACGEFSLDENRKWLETFQSSVWSMETIALRYGFLGFTVVPKDGIQKKDRNRMPSFSLQQIARYGGFDVCVPFQICFFQQKEAKRRGEQYKYFLRTMTEVIGEQIHEFAEMEANGFPVDERHLALSVLPNSEINRILDKMVSDFLQMPEVRAANQKLQEKTGAAFSRDLFGGGQARETFRIGKPEHQQVLFFDVLKLQALKYGKNEQGSIDADFLEEYEHIPVVKAFKEIKEITKVKSDFIDKFARQLGTIDDFADGRFRSDYKNLTVLTGRSAASDPNLQQIPAHGQFAGQVKRIFIAPKYCTLFKCDFSAHEIRNWGLSARDPAIADSFKPGLEAKLRYRLDQGLNLESIKNFEAMQKAAKAKGEAGKEAKERLKQFIRDNPNDDGVYWAQTFLAADSHRQNYGFFFGMKPEDVNDTQRQEVKAVVFGTLYGKGPPALARDIEGTREQAEELIAKMFNRFKGGKRWIDDTFKMGRDQLSVVSDLGRVRHMWGYLHPSRGAHGVMDRRGPNSRIQGESSDENFIAGRLMSLYVWDIFTRNNYKFRYQSHNRVHDSSESSSGIAEAPIAAYLIEHAMTTGVEELCYERFGWDFNVPLAIDAEIGGSLGAMKKWDMRHDTLMERLEGVVKWRQDQLGEKPDPYELRAAARNTDAIWRLRRTELEDVRAGHRGRMTLDWKNVKDCGFMLEDA